MGKIRSRIIGLEEVEKAQKEKQKKRSEEKKIEKKTKETEKVEKTEKKVEAPIEEVKAEKKPEKKAKKQKIEETVKQPKVVGKRYAANKKMVDPTKAVIVTEAIVLLKKMKHTAFDESVELHMNVDEVGLRGEVELPYTTGKSVRVAIVDDAMLEKLEKGVIDFDVLITHPSYMPKLAKFAKVLGPKGLMPNPKAGTISLKPEEVAKKFSKGLLRWKTEAKFPLIHQMVGKMSHEDKQLVGNIEAFIKSVSTSHIVSAYVKSTMSPSVKLDIEK